VCPIRIRNPDRSQGVFDPAMEKSYPVAKVKDPDPDPVENRPDTVHCLHVKIFLLTIITFILTPFGKQTLLVSFVLALETGPTVRPQQNNKSEVHHFKREYLPK